MPSRLLYKIVLYLFCILSVISAINMYLNTKITGNIADSMWDELFKEKIKPNVVIIGASHATGINPKHLENNGVRVFNFASPGRGPSATLKWYKQLFKKYHSKPELMIYEVNWFLFDSSWLRQKFENQSYTFPRHVFLEELMNSDNNLEMLILNRFPLFSLNIRKTLLDDAHVTIKQTDDEKPFKLNVKRFVTTRIIEEEKQAFIELLDLLKKDGIYVLLIQAPEYLEGRSCAAISKNNNMIRTIANSKHVTFINFNEDRVSAINSDATLYNDWGHLNNKGIRQFDELLLNELEPIYQRLNLRK